MEWDFNALKNKQLIINPLLEKLVKIAKNQDTLLLYCGKLEKDLDDVKKELQLLQIVKNKLNELIKVINNE